MAPTTRPVGVLALIITIIAVSAPALYRFASPYLAVLSPYLESLSPSIAHTFTQPAEHPFSSSFNCTPHTYTTEIVSLDPLLIYIDSFLSASEISALLASGEPAFAPSRVFKSGRNQDTADRTSSSAGLSRDDPAVSCVLARAETFLGTMLDPARDDIGPPQLVRYTAGQRFNRHRDWYAQPQPVRKGMMGRGRSWNRVASFFAILQDECTGGETWFPLVNATAPAKADGRFWRTHEDGGLAFRPVAGNALFWVNLFANGTGDDRTVHAGLPLEDGLKTAMNIWPRKFYA
ncbi:hypothetical protein F4821DRAFT_171421 [Hypoxylon rubiginosum]|uniref:Uncharacterized protein n=1 Tax=Hypoxylon rubiginosum TaxID=110542 RepID=A0ACC0CVC3_9PEZI|nr:hypothetical protein F4821DRAFT_171421 [Hypoxylon rubiginosum]